MRRKEAGRSNRVPLKGRSLGDRTRITGAVKMVGRPNSAEERSANN